MAAPAGNQNAAKSRLFEQTLKRAITQDDGARLRKAAEALLDKAADGEAWAMQMLADRLDGKAAQQIVGAGEGGEHLVNLITRRIVDARTDN
jgi:hypothetical protein